ncbi:MAG: hypothetical protein HOC71_07435 [Candidatus Latescibacteria bacterium]|nr:hypothetical protein [Candidatus Latescibacterota bacterium]
MFVLLLISAICQLEASAQINIYSLTTLGYTFLDNDSNINTMHRNDDPFNPVRVSLFMDKWITEDIGVFLEFLWDAGKTPTFMTTKPRINGAYAVLSPLETELVRFKIGYMPLPFGTWAPRTYPDRNPLVGIPLMQHYLTSLKGNNLAQNTDELRTWRDEDGFLTIAYDACWPYGVEVFGFFSDYEYSLAITKESMSNPGAFTNDGAQIIGRFGARPLWGLRLGISGGYSSYLSEDATGIPKGTALESVNQKIIGFDIHYSFAHTNIYSEVIRNLWENPNLDKDLGCSSWYIEANQTLLPGLYAAIRIDQLLFDSFTDSAQDSFHWDYNVTRIESGFGYNFNKDVLFKLVWQHNDIEDQDTVDLVCTQFVFKL